MLKIAALAGKRTMTTVAGDSCSHFLLNHAINEILLSLFDQGCDKLIAAV